MNTCVALVRKYVTQGGKKEGSTELKEEVKNEFKEGMEALTSLDLETVGEVREGHVAIFPSER